MIMFEKRKMGLKGGEPKPKNAIFRAAKRMVDGPDEYTRPIKTGLLVSAILGLCIVVPMQTFVWGPMGKPKAAQAAVAGKSAATLNYAAMNRDRYANEMILYAQHGTYAAIEPLLAKGADANTDDSQGITVLMYAAVFGNIEIAKLLLKNGADVNAIDKEGVTSLMWAALYGRIEIAKLLIEKGADVNAKDYAGTTVLRYAASWKSGAETGIFAYLKSKGAVE
jgi:hypothetical protein